MQSKNESYLTFKLGNEVFGASVKHVLEIIEVPRITQVPKAPKFMRGVVNLRGKVLPVVDTRVKFGMKTTKDTVDTCIVVLTIQTETQEIILGALVDAIDAVLEINHQDIQAPPVYETGYNSDLLTGMFKREENFILILDFRKVFSNAEILELTRPEETPESKQKKKKELAN